MIDVMARKVSVVTTADLDGSPDAGTVSFGLDGVSYEIDLVPANKTRLADAVARYIAAGRKVSRGRRGRERPVAMRGEPGEQLAEPLIGDAARDPPGQPGPEQAGPLVAVGGHRVMMRARAPALAPPIQRERIHQRARPGLEVEIVELPQHALAMRGGRGGITTAWPRLAGHRIRCPPL